MASNTQAMAQAFRRAQRSMPNTARDTARKIQADFRKVVSTPYPPASAPGSPPHLRTGGYRGSITANARGTNQHRAKITVVSDSMIAVWTEFGTYRDGRPYMLPRPHWRTRLPLVVDKATRHTIANHIVRAERQA